MEILHLKELGGGGGYKSVVTNAAADTSHLYQIWKQLDHYLWRYCILKFGGYECRLAANTVPSAQEYQNSITTYLRGVSTRI